MNQNLNLKRGIDLILTYRQPPAHLYQQDEIRKEESEMEKLLKPEIDPQIEPAADSTPLNIVNAFFKQMNSQEIIQ